MFFVLSAPKYTNEQASASYPLPGSGGPSPTYLPSVPDSQSEQVPKYYGAESSYTSHEASSLNDPAQQQGSTQRPPSPGRRSMFEFVSPFDALSSPPAQQQKRKPIPPPGQPSSNAGSATDDASWSAVSLDPKRKSVENLMDQLTKGQSPLLPTNQSITAQFDPYASNEDVQQQADLSQPRSRPLPPQPTQMGPVPAARASPPKPVTQQQPPPPQQQRQQQQARRSVDSPIGPPGNQAQFQVNQREKESSPLLSARLLAMDQRAKPMVPKGKTSPKYVCSGTASIHGIHSAFSASVGRFSNRQSSSMSRRTSTRFKHHTIPSSRQPSRSSRSTLRSFRGARSAPRIGSRMQ